MPVSVLISVLIPTRNKMDGLICALQSIRDTCGNNSEVQILLKIDEDDSVRCGAIPTLQQFYGVECFIGPRRAGYTDMGSFIDDVLPLAKGKWVWLFDDDSWVEGNSWFQQMESMPMDCAVNAQFYQLGPSIYNNGPDGGPVGLLIPTEVARSITPTPSPVDQTWLDVILKKGWRVNQLKGITYCHDGRPR